jgi:hypothetical protein
MAGNPNAVDALLKGALKSKAAGTRVLGRTTLMEIRKDMDRTILPSSESPPPSRVGAVRQKLKADEWRSFFLVCLVITLIRLWGSAPPDDRKHRMLVNFMHLVAALILSAELTMTPDCSTKFQFHMLKYLRGLHRLYPGASFYPVYHFSLHFGPMLSRWGPTHAWRCNAFERWNYLLQKVPTNMKFGNSLTSTLAFKSRLTSICLGEMEATMFDHFCMTQNLRMLFSMHRLPLTSAREIIVEYERTFNNDIRGTLRSDMLAFDESYESTEETTSWTDSDLCDLDDTSYKLLTEWVASNDRHVKQVNGRAFFRMKIGRLGSVLQTKEASFRDSHIVFRKEVSNWSAGCIRQIFTHTRMRSKKMITQTFFVVDAYTSLSPEDAALDHYRDFPIGGGRLFYKRFEDVPRIMTSDDIKCQFAYTPLPVEGISQECIHALPKVHI